MDFEKIRNRLKAVFERVLGKLVLGTNFLLFVIMVVMGVVLGANIALRFLFETPINWSNAVSRYAYIYIVLLGTAISYIEDGHAKIDVVYTAASPRLRVLFDLCHCLVMIFLCMVLIVYGMQHVMTMWPVHSPVVPFLSIGIVYLSVPVSAAIMIIFLVHKLLEIEIRV